MNRAARGDAEMGAIRIVVIEELIVSHGAGEPLVSVADQPGVLAGGARSL